MQSSHERVILRVLFQSLLHQSDFIWFKSADLNSWYLDSGLWYRLSTVFMFQLVHWLLLGTCKGIESSSKYLKYLTVANTVRYLAFPSLLFTFHVLMDQGWMADPSRWPLPLTHCYFYYVEEQSESGEYGVFINKVGDNIKWLFHLASNIPPAVTTLIHKKYEGYEQWTQRSVIKTTGMYFNFSLPKMLGSLAAALCLLHYSELSHGREGDIRCFLFFLWLLTHISFFLLLLLFYSQWN